MHGHLRDGATARNAFLSALPPSDLALLGDQLQAVTIPCRAVLVQPRSPVPYLYFLDDGVAALIAALPAGHRAETGLIGRESFLHPFAMLNSHTVPFEIQAQTDCRARRLPRDHFLAAMDASDTLRRSVLRHVEAHIAQAAFACLSYAVHGTVTRIARWLLMFLDRCDGDDILITHDTLARLLAVRRPTVTSGLHHLEGERLIRSERNLIQLRDRAGLEAFAAEAYGASEKAHRTLVEHA